MPWISESISQSDRDFSRKDILNLTEKAAAIARQKIHQNPKRVLLLPPDITRAHSGAGYITERLYHLFTDAGAEVHVIPTLGQHIPHTPEQNRWMFGSIPEDRIHPHDYKNGSEVIGEVPAEFVKRVTDGLVDWAMPVSINKMVLHGGWDLIINVGHVVPHEVLGFANHNKNYLIGLGGKETLCSSHMMAACCGIENNLGSLVTPLRACFNYAEENFLSHLPDCYLMVVMRYNTRGQLAHSGFFLGDDLDTYLEAAKLSRSQNVTVVDAPIKKIVAVMQGDEFYSTWVANKAVYRTRMAMADQGELLILAPGLKRFGEQPEIEAIIRKYGYVGTERVMRYWRENADLQDFANGTAHLMNGSSEGRFTIRYAPGAVSKADMESVNFQYADLNEALKRYDPSKLKTGWNTMPDGEEIFFISTPSAGLWTTKAKLENRRFPDIVS
jgi:nickel-dependent lactate racemase